LVVAGLVQLLLLEAYQVVHLFLAASLLLEAVEVVVVLLELVMGLPVGRVAVEPVGQRAVQEILLQHHQAKEVRVALVRRAVLATALVEAEVHLRLVLMVLLVAEQMAALDLHHLSQEPRLPMQAVVVVALLVAGPEVVEQAAAGLEQIVPQQVHQERQTLVAAAEVVD
jgi:hypothetical protein